jgi:hypothetical protein
MWPLFFRFQMAKQIQLTKGMFAIVDDDDYERLSQHKWRVSGRYAGRWLDKKNEQVSLMHREIAQPPSGMVVDHINGDGLDNRKTNLRVCTHSQNLMNSVKHCKSSSRFKGVTFRKNRQHWNVRVRFQGKCIEVGSFDDEIEAARAYNAAAIKYHGEFARLNSL